MTRDLTPGLAHGQMTYTIEQFCEAYNVPRSRLFLMWREGRGPRVLRLSTGPRGLRERVVIPVEAAREWLLAMTEEKGPGR